MCQRCCFFRVNAVSLFRREGEEASVQCFTCGVQIGMVGKGGVGMYWLAAERGAGFIVCRVFGNAAWVCNFMGFLFLQQAFKQERYPLTAVCFDFSPLARCLLQIMGRGETAAARFR